MTPILNWSGYKFLPLQDLESLQRDLTQLCTELGLKGTLLIAPEGFNGFVAGAKSSVQAFEAAVQKRLPAPDLVGKLSESDTVPFKRMLIKIKRETIPIGDDSVRPFETPGRTIAPRELKKWLDENRDFTLLDTRNGFEVEIGTFSRAVELGIKRFRDFADQARAQLPDEAKQKPVVMFCTGGIRCEKASLILERQGFKDVLQLDGGILKYFEECGDAHYSGQCFVFDDRRALNGQLQPDPERATEIINRHNANALNVNTSEDPA